MSKLHCHAVIVQIVATEEDDMGRPIGEYTSEPVKVFRANARDFWSEVDKSVAAMVKQREQPAGPALVKGAKRK